MMSNTAEQPEVAKKGRRKSEGRKSLGILLSLIVLCGIIAILSPRFLTVDNLRNVTSQATVSAIVSIGLFLAILTGGIDLSVGSILALSIMMMGIFQVRMGVNPYLSMLLCLGVGSLMGFINGVLLTKDRKSVV